MIVETRTCGHIFGISVKQMMIGRYEKEIPIFMRLFSGGASVVHFPETAVHAL